MEESCERAGVTADSFVGEGPVSFNSGTTESIRGSTESTGGSTESRAVAGGTSALAKSGSVMHEALCKGVEDSRFLLLACIMLSLPSAVMGIVDKDDIE